MSQRPTEPGGVRGGSSGTLRAGEGHSFWLSGIGGFVLGALTVIIVLLLTRRAGDHDEPGRENRPVPSAVQNDNQPSAMPPTAETTSTEAAASER